ARHYGLKAIFGRFLRLPSGGTRDVSPVEWDSPGADFTDEGFVRVVFADGSAEKAGLRRGDKILAVDGAPLQQVASFGDRSGRLTSLTVQRLESSPPILATLTPRRINPKEEWLEHQRKAARIIERSGKRIAYAPMFSCAGEEHQKLLQELIAGPFQNA